MLIRQETAYLKTSCTVSIRLNNSYFFNTRANEFIIVTQVIIQRCKIYMQYSAMRSQSQLPCNAFKSKSPCAFQQYYFFMKISHATQANKFINIDVGLTGNFCRHELHQLAHFLSNANQFIDSCPYDHPGDVTIYPRPAMRVIGKNQSLT